MPRNKRKKYIGRCLYPHFSKTKPEEWIEMTEGAIALDGIKGIVSDLNEQAMALSGTLLIAEHAT